jgi:sulfide:quinone oxidoreductase
MNQSFDVLIVGGGNAGISVAAQILRKQKVSIGLIDPSEKHYYQPAFTLVGAGTFSLQKTIRSEASVIPSGVKWIKESVSKFTPENNEVHTVEGQVYSYKQLVVCPGIQLDWDKVTGLKETLGKNGVTSNYLAEYTEYTWECIQNIPKNGNALFTNPNTPVKCGGAPQKIMYLAGDYLRKKGWKDQVNIEYCTAGGVIFGIKVYADSLLKMVKRYGIHLEFKHNLVAIDGPNKIATFEFKDPQGVTTTVTKSFDMIHVTPPQSAPDFIKESPLSNEKGWLNLEKHSLRHVTYNNIWGLGDVSGTPNAKTGAAIRKQAPVVTKNLLEALNGKEPSASYNGYGSCPLVVGYGKLVLAEFDYDNKPTETFPFDQSKPRWSMWILKKFILPWLYWNRILKGTA